jgi:fructose/tagatose bisphosphate aldolase
MMNLYATVEELREAVRLSGAARQDGGLVVTNPLRFRTELLDALVWTAVFGKGETKNAARHAIREAAESLGILPASILPLYRARGKGEIKGFTVPAINVRMMTYDTARAALRAARKLDVGAMIFEIARSEMGYTEQRPAEYAAVLLAAAIREEWQGPFFIQGDHFQTNPKKMKENGDQEIAAIEALIDEAIPAGFLQIDIDTSTLVDLSRPTLEAQQDVNANLCAKFTKYIRSKEPKAMPISVGGEIGEVGKENSTPEEFRAYMNVYRKALGGASVNGIEKVSVQTGSSHGGVVAADGSVERVAIDFNVIKTISKVAREEYGLAGAVQHGASTLPPEYFGHFPDNDCAEIHLATDFMNTVYDHPAFPYPLKREIERWLDDHAAEERKKGETQPQFLYKTRKKAIGPYKENVWNLPEGTKEAIAETLQEKFEFLFERLRVVNTKAMVGKYVQPVSVYNAGAVAAGARTGFVRDDQAGD